MAIESHFHPRRPADERPRPHLPQRSGPPVGRPAAPPGRFGADAGAAATTFRLRDGEREIEVSGSAGFVRQILDDLPSLLSRLRGEAEVTPSSIRMPSPSSRTLPPGGTGEVGAGREPAGEQPPHPAAARADDGEDPPAAPGPGEGVVHLEERVLAALQNASHPLPVAAIRSRLGAGVSGQQVRRILERAGSRVVATGERPVRYRLA